MKNNKNIEILLISLLILANFTCLAYGQEKNQSFSTKLGEVPELKDPEKYNQKVIPEKKPALTTLDKQSEFLLEEIPLKISQNQVNVSLEECLRKALECNFDIKIVTTQKEQSKWDYYNTISDFLPDVFYNYTLARTSGAGFLIGGFIPTTDIQGFADDRVNATSIQSDLIAEWFAFEGFSRVFRARASKFRYKAAKKNENFTKEQILVQTATQYYNLLRNKYNIEIQKKALEQTKEQLRITRARLLAGLGTKFDVLRAEAEVARSQQNLILAYNQLKLSQAQLANTLGINLFAPVMPESDVEIRTLIEKNLNIQDITEIALKNRKDISIAELNVQAAKATRNTAYSQYLPSVGVRTVLQHTGSDLSNLGRNQSIALLVNWRGGENLGLGAYTSIKALSQQLNESKIRPITTTRAVEEDVINSYYNSMSAYEVIKSAQEEVESADESLRLSVLRLEAGVGIYTDVIAAQLTQVNARVRLLNAIVDYNIAQAQLLFDMGIISVENLLQAHSQGAQQKIK